MEPQDGVTAASTTMEPNEQQQLLATFGAVDTQDELTTPMTSGSDQDEDEDDEDGDNLRGRRRRRRPAARNDDAAHSTIERQRLQSGRNRLGTPRHEIARGRTSRRRQNACDPDQLIDLATTATDQSASETGDATTPQTSAPLGQNDEAETSEPSLASSSQLNHMPPSYGTATRPVESQQPAHCRARQNDSQLNHTDSYGFLKFSSATNTAAISGELDKDRCSRQLAGQRESQCSQIPAASTSNGIYATLNVPGIKQSQQQQASQLRPRLPINHVISPQASMQQQQWPPQTNQLQAAPPPPPPLLQINTRANLMAQAEHHHHQQQQQQQLQSASSSTSSARSPSYSALYGTSFAPLKKEPTLGGATNNPKLSLSTPHQVPASERDVNTTRLESTRREEQQQQQHRKRKRHRSTSGTRNSNADRATIGHSRTLSPSRLRCLSATKELLDEGQIYRTAERQSCAERRTGATSERAAITSGQRRTKASRATTISAHCWLIDSSDDNCPGGDTCACAEATSGGSASGRSAANRHLRACSGGGGKGGASCTLGRRPAHTRARSSPRAVHQHQWAGCWSDDEAGPRRRPHERRQCSGANRGARLSGLLNFVANLVRVPRVRRDESRSSSSSPPPAPPPSSCCHLARHGATHSMPYSITSGGSSSRGRIGPGSLAYSSSNTSAYVTGSSSLQSHGGTCGGLPDSTAISATGHDHKHHQVRLLQLNCANIQSAQPYQHCIQKDLPGNDYGVAQAWRNHNHHSYQYCEQDAPPSTSIERAYDLRCRDSLLGEDRADFEQIELNSIDPLLVAVVEPPAMGGGGVAASSSMTAGSAETQSSVPPTQLVGLGNQSRLAQILINDNELVVSPGASSSRAQANPIDARWEGCTPPGLARLNEMTRNCRVATSTTSRRRNRHLAGSLKSWLSSRTAAQRTRAKLGRSDWLASCAAQSSDDSYNQRPPPPPTSYRNLKTTTTSRQMDEVLGPARPSTLTNVISLAKIDRVFRCRLLSSIIVSFVLLALICLLAVLIYKSNSSRPDNNFDSSANLFNNDNNKFNLLIDNSDDYDLTWLWSGSQSATGTMRSNTASNVPNLSANNRGELASDQRTSDEGGDQVDSSKLRSLLHLIDRSDHLAQLQLAMKHLTNLQLAQDKFIDLTQLVHALLPETESAPNEEAKKKLQASNETRRISHLDLDLASLTLLSNLHWPLVKWRHRSQQSLAANFLPFVLTPTPSISFGGTQTIRNLLSSLILAESLNPQAVGNYVNLQQFYRLQQDLKSTAYHLLVCASSNANLSDELSYTTTHTEGLYDDIEDEAARFEWIRQKFCLILVTRYKRMMLTLSQLQHNDLAELHDQRTELAPIVYAASLPAFNSIGHHQQATASSLSSNRNILNFLLDRLALLDARTVAELTLTSLENINEARGLVEQLKSDEDGKLTRNIIELLIATQMDLNEGAPPVVSEQITGQPRNSKSVYELTLAIVGENPINLMQNFDQSLQFAEQFRTHLDKMRTSEHDKWHDLLVRDIINPWPSFRLASFVQPETYELFLHPNLTTKLIYGVNKIEFQITRPTRLIAVHCIHLNVIELNLWFKQELRVPNSLNQSSIPIEPLKQIPIRRVLNIGEQLLIELYEVIGPYNTKIGTRDEQNLISKTKLRHENPIEFGELQVKPSTSQHEDQFHATTTRTSRPQTRGVSLARNQFVLTISFNKTNLMTTKSGSDGVEFVQYADPFSTAASIQAEVVVQSSAITQPHQLATTSVKTIMLSEFGGPTGRARRLFPCFNEPHLRARFQLNLVHEHAQQALFNTQRRERIQYNSNGALQMTVFEQTPIELDADQLAFVVCDLHSIKSVTSRLDSEETISSNLGTKQDQEQQEQQHQQRQQRHIQVQVWAQFEHLSQAEYASQLVPQLLAFLQLHFRFAYPLDKLDLVAMPKHRNGDINDEETNQDHLGLVWFRESLLLVDPNLVSQDVIEQISLLITRSLVHQYFGNIIRNTETNSRLILTALCQSLEMLALANTQPEWHLDEQFPVASIQQYLERANSAQFSLNILSSFIKSRSRNELDIEAEVEDDQVARLNLDLDQIGDADFLHQQQHKDVSKGEKDCAIAVVHMLLANLLPSAEAQARLLRRLLNQFKYKTISSRQFWHQFGEQLILENSNERLRLDLHSTHNSYRFQPTGSRPETSLETASQSDDGTLMTNAAQQQQQQQQQTLNERVVFVRRRQQAGRDGESIKRLPAEDVYQVSAHKEADPRMFETTSLRLVDNLELIADTWISQRGFPVVTASCHRDRVHLRQELFVFASKWWSLGVAQESPSEDTNHSSTTKSRRWAKISDEDNIEANSHKHTWQIPLMFVSRLNPRAPRFVWFNEQQMDFPLVDITTGQLFAIGNRSLATTLSEFANTPEEYLQQTGKLPLQYSWFKLNHNQTSLVRVNYDERNWEALTSLLLRSHYSNHALNSLDRANLLDDSQVLMRSGQLSVGLAMNLTLYLELGERDYQPWSTILRHLESLQRLLNQNPLWHQYVLKLIQPIGVVIGWKDDGPHLMRKLRRELFQVALQYGEEKLLTRARQDFKLWMKSSSQFLVPNLQELVYVAGVRYGDQQEWFHCWQKYQQLVALDVGVGVGQEGNSSYYSALNSQLPLHNQIVADNQRKLSDSNNNGPTSNHKESYQLLADGANLVENEKRQLLCALASTQNTWLLEQFLNYSLDSNKVQVRHLRHVMQALGKNPVARLYLWRFVRLNWFNLLERFKSPLQGQSDIANELYLSKAQLVEAPMILETMIREATKHFATRLDYEEVRTFFETKHRQSLQPGARDDEEQVDNVNSEQYPNYSNWSPSIGQAIRESLAEIEANIYWRDSIEPKLTRWLSQINNNNNNNNNNNIHRQNNAT